MSNYCACSGGDEEYTIELNQQGPPGPQGPVGPEGFSPSISVNTNTDAAYILTITNKEGSFNTPNLYGELEKLNADLSNLPNPAYLNGVILSQNENGLPSIQLDTSKATVDTYGNLVFSASATNEGTTNTFNYKLVVNPTDQRLELHNNEGVVKVVAVTDEIAIVQSQLYSKLDTATYETDKATYATKQELASTDATVASIQTSVESNTTSIGTLRVDLVNLEGTVANNTADIASLNSTKLESSNIIAGANIAIDRSGNNLTISSTGGGGGSSIDDSTTSSASTWSSSKINSVANEIRETKNDNIFDINKFTVVGSPTITDDGIASGFSGADYVKLPFIDFNSSNSWKIEIYYIVPAQQRPPGGILSPILHRCINITEGTTYGSYVISIASTASDWDILDGSLSLEVAQNNILKFTLEYSNNTYTAQAYNISTGVYSNILSTTTDKKVFNKELIIGALRNGGASPNGSIKLDKVSITVDGKLVFSGLMESTKPIYDKLSSTNTELSTFKTDTDNNFSAVNSALNEKANLSDLAGYVTVNKYNELLARVVALETEINGGNA